MLRIGIVAGEPSGDQLGAALIAALRSRCPGVEIVAMSGPRMREAGCETVADIEELSVMGLVEVLQHYPRLRRLQRGLIRTFLARRPDVFVGIDVPDFVLGIEKHLKQAGIPTVHLVCPQVWAWRAHRVPALRASVSRLLTLFPFETEFLRAHGIDATFVGHPLADRIPARIDRVAARRVLGAPSDGPLVALMPGSRTQEYRRHLPLFLAAAAELRALDPGCHFVLGVVDERAARWAAAQPLVESLGVAIHSARSRDILAASDAALCVSGTITLEAALSQTPLVVAYRMPWLTHQILKRLVRVPHIALPNLLMESPLVPELIQSEATARNLAAALAGWLQEPARVQAYRARCAMLHEALCQDAGNTVAAALLDLLPAQRDAVA